MGISYRINGDQVEVLMGAEVMFTDESCIEESSNSIVIYHLDFISKPNFEQFTSSKLKDIEVPTPLEITYEGPYFEDISSINTVRLWLDNDIPRAYFEATFSYDTWTELFSPSVFVKRFCDSMGESRDATTAWYDDVNYDLEGWVHGIPQITLHTSLNLQDDLPISEQLLEMNACYLKCYESTLETLRKEYQNSFLLKTFKFPKEYQNTCSQYLIWFGEFLENFGINALISVNHEGDETQVVISSEHTEKMFHEIEALFSQYIALPYAEFLPAPTQSLSVEQRVMITTLQSQVNHFKSQLEMKNASLELKNATIQSLQNTVDVQKNQLLLIESIQGDDELELFGGAIKIGDVEWGPIKISPKALLDKAKR
ncbi:hypothetical protein ACVBOS_001109 [Vibrio vulnificus]